MSGQPSRTPRDRIPYSAIAPGDGWRRILVKRVNDTDLDAVIRGIEAVVGRGNLKQGPKSQVFYVFFVRG